MASSIYKVTLTHDNETIGILNGYPFKEPKIAYTLKRPKEQQFFTKSFKGSLYIRKKDDPVLYQKLFELLNSSKKCDWFYADIEWQCAGENFTDFFSGKFSIVSDAKWDFGDCTISIKLKPNDFWECIKEHKDVEVGFYHLTPVGIEIPDDAGTVECVYCSRPLRRKHLNNGDFVFNTYAQDDTNQLATPFNFDNSTSTTYTIVCPKVMAETKPVNSAELVSGFDKNGSTYDMLPLGKDVGADIQVYTQKYPKFWWEDSSKNEKRKRKTKKYRYYETKWCRERIYAKVDEQPDGGYELAIDNGDGYGWWVREPDGLRIDVINNSRRLNDVIVTYFENHPCGWGEKTFNSPYANVLTEWEGVQSGFLNIDTLDTVNPTGPDQNTFTSNIYNDIKTPNDSDPYSYAKLYYQDLFVTHKTDVKYPDATEAAGEKALKWTWEHIEDIFNILNLYFWVEVINGLKILRIEHFYYKYKKQQSTPINITNTNIYKKYIEKSKHTFSLINNQLPSREKFSWMDEDISAAFAGEDIVYTAACSTADNSKETKIKNFTTDVTAVAYNSNVLNNENETLYEFGNDIEDDGFVLISTNFLPSQLSDEDINDDYILKNSNEFLQWKSLHNLLYDYNRFYDIGIVNSENRLLYYTRPIFKSGKYRIPYQCNKHPFNENDFVDINHPVARLGLPKDDNPFDVEPVEGVGEINEMSIISSNTGCWMEFDLRWACVTEISCNFNDVNIAIDVIKICPGLGGSIYGVAVDLDVLISGVELTDTVEVYVGKYGTYEEEAVEDLTNGLFNGNGVPKYYWYDMDIKVVIKRLKCPTIEIIKNVQIFPIGSAYNYDENSNILDDENTVEADGFNVLLEADGNYIDHFINACDNKCVLDEITADFYLIPHCPPTLPNGNTFASPYIGIGFGVNINGADNGDVFEIVVKKQSDLSIVNTITTSNLTNIELVELIGFQVHTSGPPNNTTAYQNIIIDNHIVCINKQGCQQTNYLRYLISIDGDNPINYTGTQYLATYFELNANNTNSIVDNDSYDSASIGSC